MISLQLIRIVIVVMNDFTQFIVLLMTTQNSDFTSNRSMQGSPLKPKASSVASISEWESKMENLESHR